MERNPYAPSAQCEHIEQHKSGSAAITVAVSCGLLGFVIFTFLLLNSSPGDQKVGMLYLLNIPFLTASTYAAYRSANAAVICLLASASVQLVITTVLFWIPIGDASAIVGINSAIIIPCLLIAVWAWAKHQSNLRMSRI